MSTPLTSQLLVGREDAGSAGVVPTTARRERIARQIDWRLERSVSQGEYQQGLIRLSLEMPDGIEIKSKHRNDGCGIDVSNVEPDHFWRVARNKTLIAEVRIFRHDRETAIARELSDRTIGSSFEAYIPYVGARGILAG
jgi:hypothetical protein